MINTDLVTNPGYFPLPDPIPSQGIESVRLRLRVPRDYHQEPIITTLAQRYPLKVNIRAALLGANGQEDGWFDLELQGSRTSTEAACQYLASLGLELWYESVLEDW